MKPTKFWIAALGLKLAVLLAAAFREEKRPVVPIPGVEDVRQVIYENIKYDDGFLLVRDALLETLIVVPADIPWAVKCGFGFTVAFARHGEVSTDLQIFPGFIPREHCLELAPMAARTVTMVAAGRTDAHIPRGQFNRAARSDKP